MLTPPLTLVKKYKLGNLVRFLKCKIRDFINHSHNKLGNKKRIKIQFEIEEYHSIWYPQ